MVAPRSFQVRGRFLTAIALRLENETPDEAFFDALDSHVQLTPKFFYEAPLVVDFEKVPGLVDEAALRDLIGELRKRKLMVFAAQNANAAQREVALAMGLVAIGGGREAPLPSEKSDRGRRVDAPGKAPKTENLVITEPVRSGQMIVAERGDLTVIGSVASGAELVAAGSIHVYGTLRGRAMAGVHGDETARIFCQKLDAELVAIAGLYRTNENIEDAHRNARVQVFLDKERLRMETLG
nr:septum site-determining protein MinC [Pseudoruegeria sp. HB172150]